MIRMNKKGHETIGNGKEKCRMCGLTTASFYSLYDGKQVYFCSRPCHEKYNAQKAKTPNILLIQLDKDKTQDDPQDAKEEDIFEACHRGDANSDRLVSLLEEGTSANLQNNQGQTLLTYSISKGDIRTTRVLLSAGADVDKRDNKSKTALMVAASIGAEKKMGVLLKRGANALLQDAEGKTALHMTESNTTPDCVKLLLHHEPELLNIKNNFDQTVAHLVAGAGNETILMTLLDHGVCIDDLDNLGRAPLHYAVLEKAVTCVPILLDAINGVNVLNLADRFGSCPIHYAVQLNNTEIVKMLIEKDCDVNIPNPAGRTSLLIATAEGFWDICQLLVGKCDDINATDKEGFSALHYAARVGESELCGLLIKHGADVNLRNNQEQTPMFSAVSNGHTEVVHTLVEQGAKCDDITDARGRNLFHYAAENGHKAMLRVLLQYSEVCDGEGCDVCNPDDNPIHTKDDDGHTTLYLAVVNRHIDCIKMLIKRGVFVDEDSYRLLGEMGLIDIVDKKRRLGNEEEDGHYGNDRGEEDPAVWKKKYMEQKKRTISLEDQLNKLKLQLDQHQKRMTSHLERRQDRVNVLQRLRDPQLVLCQQTHDNELLRMHVQLVQTKAASETTLRNLRQKEINEIRSLRTDYRNAYATFAPKYQSINRLLNLPDWLLPTKVQYGTHPTKSKWTKASRKVTSQMKPFQKNGTYSETFSNRRISNSNQNEASNALEKPENRQSTKSAEF